MMKISVGVTTGYSTPLGVREERLLEPYLRAVSLSGARPTLLHPDSPHRFHHLDGVDGLILTGGGDIPPSLWGETPAHRESPQARRRAQFEIPLVREAYARGLPVLGICLGLQVMNVALGGTLYQDLETPEQRKRHMKRAPGASSYHEVVVVQDTCLASLLPERVRVNSRHHQAVKRLAEVLRVAARAADGVIEAIESASHPWFIGVQWHPEDLLENDPWQRTLIESFIQRSYENRPQGRNS